MEKCGVKQKPDKTPILTVSLTIVLSAQSMPLNGMRGMN